MSHKDFASTNSTNVQKIGKTFLLEVSPTALFHGLAIPTISFLANYSGVVLRILLETAERSGTNALWQITILTP